VGHSFKVITVTEVKSREVHWGHRLIPFLDSIQNNRGTKAYAVMADSKYGTIGNLFACHDRGLRPYISDLKKT
jgi:hypothetical protein